MDGSSSQFSNFMRGGAVSRLRDSSRVGRERSDEVAPSSHALSFSATACVSQSRESLMAVRGLEMWTPLRLGSDLALLFGGRSPAFAISSGRCRGLRRLLRGVLHPPRSGSEEAGVFWARSSQGSNSMHGARGGVCKSYNATQFPTKQFRPPSLTPIFYSNSKHKPGCWVAAVIAHACAFSSCGSYIWRPQYMHVTVPSDWWYAWQKPAHVT